MVDPIGPLKGLEPLSGASAQPAGAGTPGATDGPRFEDVLRESIQDVNKLQSAADQALEDLSVNKVESVAEVMTAVEKADIAFRTLMQVRNKLVDAYQELLRIRV